MSLSVSIVIPTYRRSEVLRRTLRGIARLEMPAGGFELVVVDNADDPATRAVLAEEELGPVPGHLLPVARRGAAAARNEGARRASGEFLLFLDDDMVPQDSAMLIQHLATHRRHQRALVAGSWAYLPETLADLRAAPFGRWRLDLELGWKRQRAAEALEGNCVRVHTLSASNFSLRRELFWALGGFNEEYPYAGAEDQDLSLRATAAGCELILNESIRMGHNETWIGFDQFCRRQELGAHSVIPLAREFPDGVGRGEFVQENWPVSSDDGARLVAKKLSKALLMRRLPLKGLHRLVQLAERVRLPEGLLRRLYSVVVGVHIFKGVRDAIRAEAAGGKSGRGQGAL